ncbi:AAA family ATPase [Alteromonas sp. a30]|uniref:AAA family ATPase n=1 Tax=Alteromonas sp. a30 TaxID=2730917 RepID=UPI00228170E0|nr:MoxR family ATPase [Alteromonas sp. a30]MCY7296977.1 MoxR family ATPase [Alteromonas sp. a30]
MNHIVEKIIHEIGNVVVGKQEQIRLALSCLLCNGHLLIEDLPGMGKTTLSHSLAKTLGLMFSRVQFTSDLLPADILGVNIFDNQKTQFQFHPGPIFTNLLLADEINRSNPKTQSALLEAMEEKQVTIDGETHPLPTPFIVIATQNPMYQSGTYALPESQLDRFLMRIHLGYPDWQSEKRMLEGDTSLQLSALTQCITPTEFNDMQQRIRRIEASAAIFDYILKLVTLTRESDAFPNSLSPRASKAILAASRAWAFISGRDYVIPEDVQAILPAVAEHRIRSTSSDINSQQPLTQLLLEEIDPLAA